MSPDLWGKKCVCLFVMVEIKKRRMQVVDHRNDVSWETPCTHDYLSVLRR